MIRHQAQLDARKSLLRRGIQPLIEHGDPLEKVLARLIENIEGQTEKMLAAIFLYDPASNDLCVGAAPNLQPSYQKAVNGFKVGPTQPACGSAVFRGERVITPDVKTDPRWRELCPIAEGARIRAVWSEPLFDDKKNVLGTLAFYFPEPRIPDEGDLTVLKTAADLASLAIQCRREQFLEINRRRRRARM